jgi:hypothetical protein
MLISWVGRQHEHAANFRATDNNRNKPILAAHSLWRIQTASQYYRLRHLGRGQMSVSRLLWNICLLARRPALLLRPMFDTTRTRGRLLGF